MTAAAYPLGMKPSPLMPPSFATPRRLVPLRELWLPDFDIPPQAPGLAGIGFDYDL